MISVAQSMVLLMPGLWVWALNGPFTWRSYSAILPGHFQPTAGVLPSASPQPFTSITVPQVLRTCLHTSILGPQQTSSTVVRPRGALRGSGQEGVLGSFLSTSNQTISVKKYYIVVTPTSVTMWMIFPFAFSSTPTLWCSLSCFMSFLKDLG